MKRVVQPSPWSCLAAVAAMIADVPVELVFAHIGHDGSEVVEGSPFPDGRRPIRITEIAGFLASRGYMIGGYRDFKGAQHRQLPSGDCRGLSLVITVSTCDPALLIVEGVNYNHAVFWTGRDVLDPRPDRHGTRDLDDYAVLEWWPVARVV